MYKFTNPHTNKHAFIYMILNTTLFAINLSICLSIFIHIYSYTIIINNNNTNMCECVIEREKWHLCCRRVFLLLFDDATHVVDIRVECIYI